MVRNSFFARVAIFVIDDSHSPPVFTPSHSRERNRVHARNTRERKKQLMDGLKGKIEALFEEVSFDPI